MNVQEQIDALNAAVVRNDFEEAAFNAYFMSNIVKGNSQFMGVNPDIKTMAEFLKQDGKGHYLESTLDSAWWAWKKAHEKYTK